MFFNIHNTLFTERNDLENTIQWWENIHFPNVQTDIFAGKQHKNLASSSLCYVEKNE